MNQEDIEQVKKDFHRFSKLHSWYKHLPVDGKIFVFYKQEGQQVRYDFDKCLTEADQNKEYWCFLPLDRNKELIKKHIESGKELYWAKFGAFLRGIEGSENEYFWGFHLIDRYDRDKKIIYVKNKYPNIISDKFNHYDESQIIVIAKTEYQEYLNGVLEFKKFTLDML